jgi:trimeric autotransporter adhesin
METKMKKTIYTLIAMIGFANFTMAQVPSYVPTNGLAAWYPFSGNANDASGNGNNGTVTSASLRTDRFGNTTGCYEFTSSSSKIDLGNNINPTTAFTLSAWVYSYGQGQGFAQTIISKRGRPECAPFHGFDLRIANASNRIIENSLGAGSTWGASVNTTSGFNSDNNWTHLITTYDGAVAKIYLNGVLTTSANSSYYCAYPCFTVIGNRKNDEANTFYFNGRIDDVGIWNRALTQQEITALYTAIDCIDTITKQPTNQMVNINTNASFIVATTDSLANYQWQTDVGMGFQNISSAGQYNGATNDTLIVSNTSMTNNNQNFRCIVSSGSCKDTSSIGKLTVNNNTGINSPSNVNALKVYPNPASTLIHIDLEKPGYYTAKLSSFAGQSIVTPTTGTIDTSALANGVYILTIYDSNNQLISTNKVAIVRQ